MADRPAPEPLTTEDAARVAEFARACRSATRAVTLYPPEHAAIGTALVRLVDVCGRALGDASWVLDVTPAELLLGGRGLPRPDTAVTELAELLHAHYIGQIVVHPGADDSLWLRFLQLVGRPADDVRRQGGIARVWATLGGRPIEIHEIDYGAVLREGTDGDESSWAAIVRNCLRGTTTDLNERDLRMLAEIVADPDRLLEISRRLEEQSRERGTGSSAAVLVAIIRNVIESVMRVEPGRVEPMLDSVASAATQLPPDVMLELLSARDVSPSATSTEGVLGRIVSRLADAHVAAFLARSVTSTHGATARLAEAFFALVPQPARRTNVLGLARREVARLSSPADIGAVWRGLEQMLQSYEDGAYVSDGYARNLDTARRTAEQPDRITDDPPDRIAGWLATVTDGAVRAFDLQMLLDLVVIEDNAASWRELGDIIVRHLDDILLVGDWPAAVRLVQAIAGIAADPSHESRQQAANEVVQHIIEGQTLLHIVSHLQAIDDDEFARVKTMATALGPGVIRPLAEMLAVQEQPRVRQRLTDLLLAFGALGRQCAEQLKTSANPSVRRVAVYLLREFGGTEALPELESLVDDSEPHVQRDAVRAVVKIGTDEAYSVLARALRLGSARSRDAILWYLDTTGDERAAALFAYIVRSGECQKAMRPVYVKAVSALGRLGGEEAIDALKAGLYRGEWWAPFRTAALRQAAVQALARIGTAQALEVLDTARRRGPRGVRRAAGQARLTPARADRRGEPRT